jgi:hypothetical protein
MVPLAIIPKNNLEQANSQPVLEPSLEDECANRFCLAMFPVRFGSAAEFLCVFFFTKFPNAAPSSDLCIPTLMFFFLVLLQHSCP